MVFSGKRLQGTESDSPPGTAREAFQTIGECVMKRTVVFLALALVMLFAVACGSSHMYTVERNDGPAIVSTKEPEFDRATSTYMLKDLDGNEVIIKRENVVSIREHNR